MKIPNNLVIKQFNNAVIKFLPYLLVLFAIAFNFYTLFPELSTKSDLNDNIFQYSLVVRMNEIWENKVFNSNFKFSILNLKFLFDHWVPYWASGYPLPFYYQHLPHLFIVFIYHLIFETISLYDVFKLVKFFLWVITPISFYLSSRMLGFSKSASALSSFFGSQILTDGLYGTDVSSFSWRGYGLTTQLFAIFFAPLALGKIYQVMVKCKIREYILAILLLAATFASHMAIGYILALSALFIPLALIRFPNNFSIQQFNNFIKGKERGKIKAEVRVLIILFLILFSTFLLLSYWFIPLLLGNTYHNISFWDPPLKWNSYGYRQVINMFLDGELYDFSRPPILTFLVIAGFLICLYKAEKSEYRLFSLLFPFWFILLFGRTTWGNLINLLPMMKEMHQQRLINGLQLVSIPLMGIGAEYLLERLKKGLLGFGILGLLGFLVYKANYDNLKLNKIWLGQANQEYEKLAPDFEKLVAKIKELPPGRIYAGRPGNWGREFKIGATQSYLALTTYGLNINGFLPETWSLNSDPEPFFDENRLDHYQLYNVRYLITPKDFKLANFAKKIATFGPFNLSSVETPGYFDLGTSNLLVNSQKENILNIIHFWLVSDLVGKKEFPTLSLTGKTPNLPYTTKIFLKGTNLYEEGNQIKSLFSLTYPLQKQPSSLGEILSEKITDEIYQTNVKVNKDCSNCLVIFKMTYHPNWRVKLNNQPTEKIMVFPSFMAVQVPPGSHSVSFEYQPSFLKSGLLILGIISLFCLSFLLKKSIQL